MKNYCLDENLEGQYIVNATDSGDGTLAIEFADGTVFKHIAFCEENIEKIIAIQEEQAKKGVENFAKFKTKRNSSIARTAMTGLGIAAAGVGASFIPAIQDIVSSQNPAVVYAGIGAIAILGSIPACAKLRKNNGTVKELEKLRFREEHLEDLQQLDCYPNALAGVNPRLANWIRQEEDPFCILYTDEYELSDLRRIVSNIETEKAFGFTYQKRSK